MLLCPVPQRLQEAVKEGNLEPREQAVALEAQVCLAAPPDFLLPDSTLPVLTLLLCLSTEEGLPRRDPRVRGRRPEVQPVLQQTAG